MNRTAHVLAVVVACVCFALYALAGFGEITLTHAAGWLGLGLVALALALL